MTLEKSSESRLKLLELSFTRVRLRALRKQPRDGVIFKDGSVKEGKTVIYTAGTSYRHLAVAGGEKQRISYCAVCDGFFYKDKVVAVVGGGDTALGDALYLSKLAKTVYLIHRRDEFRANKALQKKVAETDNIVPVMSAVIKEVTGGENAEGITYTQNNEEKNIAVDGVFCAIGSVPNTQALEGVCELDESGYVKAGEDGITLQRVFLWQEMSVLHLSGR